MADSTSKLQSAFWPSIGDRATAHRVAKQGFWAAVVVASVTAVLAALPLFGVTFLNVGPLAFLDAGLFAVIGFGILKMSRIAAVAGFLLFVAERVSMWLETGKVQGWILAVFLAFAFLNAARATFALRRLDQVDKTITSEPVVPK